jgi:putative transposase
MFSPAVAMDHRVVLYSVLDLQADWRGAKYVEETIKMLPEKPEPLLFARILSHVASLGRIHVSPPAFSFS